MRILLLLISFTLLISCKDEPKTDNSTRCAIRPCPSTFSCMVNGETWKPKGQGHSCQAVMVDYYPEGGDNIRFGHFSILSQYCGSNLIQKVYFSFDTVIEPQVLNLKDEALTAGFKQVYDTIPVYNTYDSILAGEVDLKHIQANGYDSPNSPWGRAKGTFWMTLMNDEGDTVNITEGIFDVAVP